MAVGIRLRASSLALIPFLACAGPENQTDHSTPASSPAPQTIEFDADDLAALPQWRLDSNPLIIGVASGQPAYLLNRAGMPWRLSRGQIVVPNNQTEIRWYDSTGRHIRTVGRKGQGPEEFAQLWSVYPTAGDSILATDAGLNRVSVLDSAGHFASTMKMPAASLPIGVHWLTRRSVAYLRERETPRQVGVPDTTVVVDSAFLLRTSLGDSVADTLARLKGSWHFAPIPGSYETLKFSGETLLSTGPGTIVAAHGDDFVLFWFDSAGRPRRTVRATIAPQRIPREMIDAYEAEVAKARQLMNAGGGPAPTGPARYAQYAPALTRLVVARTGQVWARRWAPDDARSAEWIVFDTTGAPVARTSLPRSFVFADAGGDHLLGRFTDEDGVQSIRKYKLLR